MKKHILVISQCFYPEQFRINDICRQWIKRGYRVTVVTAIPNYPQGKFYEGYGLNKNRREKYEGMDIIRLPIIPRGNNVIMLCLNYLSFVISGFFWSKLTRLEADVVFNFETSPITQSLLGVWYSRRTKKPFYLYIQDLWPENVESVAGVKNKTVLNLIGKMVDYIYANSTKIFATSKSMVEAISSRGVADKKLYYWPQYAEDFYKPVERAEVAEAIKEKFDEKKFNLIFTGNIGYAQGLDILPRAAVKLEGENIMFNIVGDGRYREELIHKISELGVSEMFNFHGRKPAIDIPSYMAMAEVAILTLSDSYVFEMTIPAKLQSYMACKKPIIACAKGETKKIIEDSSCGLAVDISDEDKFVEAIRRLKAMKESELEQMAENGYKYASSSFNMKHLLDEMDRYFDEV